MPREAPRPALPFPMPPAATVAGDGSAANGGAGSHGTGTGAGGSGTGAGGGGGGLGGPAVRIAGALRDSDYPREAEAQGLSGTVGISFRVRTDGAIDRCSVTRSSGSELLDRLTCRLFTQRFRFRPASNGAGQPIDSTLSTSFTWGTRRRR
jgi:protein TonB